MAIILGKDCLLLLEKNHMRLELLDSVTTCHMFLIFRCQKLLHSVQGTLPEAVLILSLLQKKYARFFYVLLARAYCMFLYVVCVNLFVLILMCVLFLQDASEDTERGN
jgi:hypothetical protein